MIVCLDYQNHSSALPLADMPQPWSPPTASSCSPPSQLCSPPEGPVGPVAQHCPVEGSDSAWAPGALAPDYVGFAITVFSPCCPYHALLPSSGRRKPKDLKVGVGGGFSLSHSPFPTPLTPQPRETLLIPEKTIER